ncbi:hypothetical protein XaC1_415 [Xanthomonas phage XaC1]|nr:hypothetical protein XaC1_415 [Xanthomonas phage XaC1]
MKYYFYSDFKDCNILSGDAEEMFTTAVNDVDELVSYGKLNGKDFDLYNQPSIKIKKHLFGTAKGHIYVFETVNELSEPKLKVLKNSLIMNIMGNVQIVPTSDFLKDDVFKNYLEKQIKSTKKSYDRILLDKIDTRYNVMNNYETSDDFYSICSRMQNDYYQSGYLGIMKYKANWDYHDFFCNTRNFIIHTLCKDKLKELE